jgi:hypothetical protein
VNDEPGFFSRNGRIGWWAGLLAVVLFFLALNLFGVI